MRAVDTNVIVRYLVADDAEQYGRARAVFAGGDVFVAATVVLETEWVLRGIYRFAPAKIIDALRAIAGLPGLSVEDHGRFDIALRWASTGMDFADAMHLAASSGCEAFVSFDRKLARAARQLTGIAVVEP